MIKGLMNSLIDPFTDDDDGNIRQKIGIIIISPIERVLEMSFLKFLLLK
jgi:hypothetical protein